jgi:hypothetical protein
VRALLTAPQGISDGLVRLDTASETRPAAGEPPAKLDPNKGEKSARNRRVDVFVMWSKATPVRPTGKDLSKALPDIDFLQARHVGPRLLEPLEETRQCPLAPFTL